MKYWWITDNSLITHVRLASYKSGYFNYLPSIQVLLPRGAHLTRAPHLKFLLNVKFLWVQHEPPEERCHTAPIPEPEWPAAANSWDVGQDCWNGNAKAPRPHQFYMRGMNATSAPPAHSLRSSCVNHARFIRNSLATVRWLCVVFRHVFVTHNHAFALFGAFSCLCAKVRDLLVICAWSLRSSCAIHRWFFIT